MGYSIYYLNGKIHRESGKAFFYPDVNIGTYYLFGKKVRKEDIEQLLQQRKINDF